MQMLQCTPQTTRHNNCFTACVFVVFAIPNAAANTRSPTRMWPPEPQHNHRYHTICQTATGGAKGTSHTQTAAAAVTTAAIAPRTNIHHLARHRWQHSILDRLTPFKHMQQGSWIGWSCHAPQSSHSSAAG